MENRIMDKLYVEKEHIYFNKYLEFNFIPRHIEFINYKNIDTGEYEVKPTIDLEYIISFNYKDKYIRHTLQYLAKVGVLVNGQSPLFYLENYNYVFKLLRKKDLKKIKSNTDLILIKQYINDSNVKSYEELVKNNIGIVKYLAYRFSKITGLSMEEFESYGYEGLLKAINNYNANISNNLSKIFYNYVKNEMRVSIPYMLSFRRNDFPDSYLYAKSIVEEEKHENLKDNKDLVYLIVDKMYEMNRLGKAYMRESIDRILITIPDYLEDYDNEVVNYEDNYFGDVEKEERENVVYECLGELTDLQRQVLEYLCGFKGRRYSHDEIANILGIEKNIVRSIWTYAMVKLRRQPTINKLSRIKDDNIINNLYGIKYAKKY